MSRPESNLLTHIKQEITNDPTAVALLSKQRRERLVGSGQRMVSFITKGAVCMFHGGKT